MKTERRNFALVLTPDNVLWAIGGTCGSYMTRDIEYLDLGEGKKANWQTFCYELSSARENHSAIHWKGEIFIVGGYSEGGKPIKHMETFKISSRTDKYTTRGYVTYRYGTQYALRGPAYSSRLCKLTSVGTYEGALYTTGEFYYRYL